MKQWPIISLAIEHERDVVAVRQRARRVSDLLGFALQDQTKVATAASEIARNAVSYAGGGKAELLLEGVRIPERLVLRVSDSGPSIADLDAVLEGRFKSTRGLGVGIIGSRRLMDSFTIDSRPGVGTTVVMGKNLPERPVPISPMILADISKVLAQEAPTDALAELRTQNQELVRSLELAESRHLEALHLSDELEKTNKGVVALYAELDLKAVELQGLNETLEQRIAAAIADRQQIEENLRQSQKMEAVGQLTGGIAHDFNNLLMIIGGSLEMIRRRVKPDDTLTRLFDAARDGISRGAKLNHQLLAFARRQDLNEDVIHVDDFRDSFQHLVERAVDEAIGIRIEFGKDVWFCRSDPHQLETAVLNLAINARDAMPRGGTITLMTENRHVDAAAAALWEGQAGDYVAVSVTDTGTGIAPEMLKRVLEPFYTTKPVGQGTGLGLSQVYGFAKQSGGFLSIESELGRGATVSILLPRAEPAAMATAAVQSTVVRVEGSARILVVEDDEAVRSTTSAMLRDLGYTVLEAGSGHRALDILGRQDVDLVFSDVILPDAMSGIDLSLAVKERYPHLPILLTSGYTAQRLQMADEAARFSVLRKPYSEAQLSAAISAALQDGHGA